MSYEVEDGMGCAGLVPTREDKYISNLEDRIKELEKHLRSAQIIIQNLYPKAITFPEIRDLIQNRMTKKA